MKISKGNMAHRVMTLLKMALRELRAGKDTEGSAKASVLLHDWLVTKDIFWDVFRRLVRKYVRVLEASVAMCLCPGSLHSWCCLSHSVIRMTVDAAVRYRKRHGCEGFMGLVML